MKSSIKIKLNTTKRISLLSFLLVNLFAISSYAQTGIEGQWKDNEKGITISIYEEDGKYFGQLISSDDAEQNEQIQTKEKIVLRKDFEKKSNKKFCCGTIYQPKFERTLNATLFLEDENTLKVKAKFGIFSGTRIWERL